jgi:hypothetical protein
MRIYPSSGLVFAELTQCRDLWQNSLKELDVIKSTYHLEIEARGEARGEMRHARSSVLTVANARYGAIPEELEKAINACQDITLLDQFLLAVITCNTLAKFRKKINL